MNHQLKKVLNLKLLNAESIITVVNNWKKEGKKIIFTNGCFDILHPGHLCYLMEAAELGDKLLVAINSDKAIKRIKGHTRPVNNQFIRACMLSSLFFVDAVVVFDEDTPKTLISTVKPDILVKGGDYEVANIAGSREVLNYGGQVKILSFIKGYSTSAIIKQIQQTDIK